MATDSDKMVFELLPDDLEEQVERAVKAGGSGNFEIIGELAKRFPQAIFTRQSTDRTFTADMVRAAYEENIEMRPEKL